MNWFRRKKEPVASPTAVPTAVPTEPENDWVLILLRSHSTRKGLFDEVLIHRPSAKARVLSVPSAVVKEMVGEKYDEWSPFHDPDHILSKAFEEPFQTAANEILAKIRAERQEPLQKPKEPENVADA